MKSLIFLFRAFSFTDFSCARHSKQVFSALAFGKIGRFLASCCLSIGCIARYAPSFCAAICSKTDSKSQEINL